MTQKITFDGKECKVLSFETKGSVDVGTLTGHVFLDDGTILVVHPIQLDSVARELPHVSEIHYIWDPLLRFARAVSKNIAGAGRIATSDDELMRDLVKFVQVEMQASNAKENHRAAMIARAIYKEMQALHEDDFWTHRSNERDSALRRCLMCFQELYHVVHRSLIRGCLFDHGIDEWEAEYESWLIELAACLDVKESEAENDILERSRYLGFWKGDSFTHSFPIVDIQQQTPPPHIEFLEDDEIALNGDLYSLTPFQYAVIKDCDDGAKAIRASRGHREGPCLYDSATDTVRIDLWKIIEKHRVDGSPKSNAGEVKFFLRVDGGRLFDRIFDTSVRTATRRAVRYLPK